MPSQHRWIAQTALLSYMELCAAINELTEQEVLDCLKLEAATQRRRSFMNRLIARAARLSATRVTKELKAKYAPS